MPSKVLWLKCFCNVFAGPAVGLCLGKVLSNAFAGFDWN